MSFCQQILMLQSNLSKLPSDREVSVVGQSALNSLYVERVGNLLARSGREYSTEYVFWASITVSVHAATQDLMQLVLLQYPIGG
jgi:hypothetical protein